MVECSFSPPCVDVLGVKVSAIDIESAVDTADQWIHSIAGHGYICATGAHGVMEARADEEVRRILNDAFMNVPDGMPMTWVGRLQGSHHMDRVFGPDLMAEIC